MHSTALARFPAAVLLVVCSTAFAQSVTPQAPAGAPVKATSKDRADIYDVSAKAEEQINAALAKAARNNTRVLIQWGGNWCGWCHLLHDTFTKDRTVAKTLQYEYEVVLVDIGHFDKHMDVAAKYGAELQAKGVPYLTVLDATGKVLANQETGTLERGSTPEQGKEAAKGHDPAKVNAFLQKNQAPALEASAVLDAALAQAKAKGRNVFLHFGAPWCGWCHRLEAWMARPEVASALGADFIDLKVDTERMTGGQALYEKLCAKPGGIPWIALLNEKGEVITHASETGDNFGFPAEKSEIERFEAMLRKGRKTLSDAQVTALGDSLREAAKATKPGH